jgi:hypothetical protein
MPYELPYKMPNKETINDMVTQKPSGSGSNVNQNISIPIGSSCRFKEKMFNQELKNIYGTHKSPTFQETWKNSILLSNFQLHIKT